MNQALTILVASYLLGALPRSKFFPPLTSRAIILREVTTGAAAALLAKLVVGTELGIILAGIAVLAGHNWAPYPSDNFTPGMVPTWGVLLFLSPFTLAAMASLWLLSSIISKDFDLSSFLTYLSLPFLLWYFKRYDVYILFGLICAGLVIHQHLSHREKNADSPPELIRRATLQKNIFRRGIMTLIVFFLATSLYFTRYVYRGFSMQIDLIRTGNQELNFVSLTFDDGPDPIYTPLILDILKDYDIKASFFLIGRHAEKYPEIARRIGKEGHDIGNHTYSHRSLVPLSQERTDLEILRAEEAIEAATGLRPYFFRPPRGIYSSHAREFLRERQYSIVLWSLSTKDWIELSARDLETNVLKKVKAGDIILFHDSGNIVSTSGGNRINTVKALPRIIEGLWEKGYSIVPVSDLLLISGLTTTEPLH